MANQEQLDILEQGVEAWNKWRTENPDVRMDLNRAHLGRADLSSADLSGANLSDVDLRGTHLSRANLSRADLSGANLSGADLNDADLSHAFLRGADLSRADLSSADLSSADLSHANLYDAELSDAFLRGTNLSRADLSRADLSHADLSHADLGDADLGDADLIYTVFGDVDLSTVKGLETVKHIGPSTIGIDTIIRSQGKIPEIFLRGAGVPDSIIEAIPSLLGSLKPIDYYSCFISYSSKDQAFAERLHADLQSKGIRCWFAPHDMKIGDEIRPRIDESIRVHDKLLLVLSESSLASTWVKKEVETAFEKEAQQQKLVLFPIRLDDTVMHTQEAWAADIRRMRHIGDFRHWKDHNQYQKAFTRLLRDLQATS